MTDSIQRRARGQLPGGKMGGGYDGARSLAINNALIAAELAMIGGGLFLLRSSRVRKEPADSL